MKEQLPLVSICIPNYNNGETIRTAIESGLNQTYGNVELIVVDNCSTDDSWKIIQSYDDPKLTLIQNESNMGMVCNFETCRSKANGEWMLWLCADDILLPTAIDSLIQPCLENNECVMSVGEVEYFGEKSGRDYNLKFKGKITGRNYRELSLKRAMNLNYICATLFNREKAKKIRLLNNTYFDWNFWLKLSFLGNVHGSLNKIAFYRFHDSNQTLSISRDSWRQYLELKKSVLDVDITGDNTRIFLETHLANYIKQAIRNRDFKGLIRILKDQKDISLVFKVQHTVSSLIKEVLN